MGAFEDIEDLFGNRVGGGSFDNLSVDAGIWAGKKVVGKEYRYLLYVVRKDL